MKIYLTLYLNNITKVIDCGFGIGEFCGVSCITHIKSVCLHSHQVFLKMKKTLLLSGLFILTSIFFLAFKLNAQAPNWNWSQKAGGNQFDFGSSVKVDVSGNSYVTGGYSSSSITFGPMNLTNYSTGTPDIFVTKYDANGTVLWAKSFGGNGYDVGSSIAFDAVGNCYVTGYFTSTTIDFNGTMVNHSSNSNGNVFLLKLDNLGNVLWAKGFGGNGNTDIGKDVAALPNGGCTIVGSFSDDTLHFDGNFVTSTSAGPSEGFIAKFDASGNNVWCKSIGGFGDDFVNNIGIDQNSNFYVAGGFSSEIIYADTLTVSNDTTDGTNDMYVAKYDSFGNINWLKGMGGNADELFKGLVTDAQGNSWITGDYRSENILFDATLITRPVANNTNQFVAKLNSAGAVQWVKNYGGDLGLDGSNCIAVDVSGNCYYNGVIHSNTITFGSINLTKTNVDGNEFILKLNSNGIEYWVKSYATKGTTQSISTDALGNAYITGNFQNSSVVFGNSTLANAGVADMFIAKLDATLGIDEVNVSNSILYPNPVTTNLVLQTNFNVKNGSLLVYNTLGEVVYTMDNLNGNSFNLNTENLSKNVYFIRLQQNGETVATHKFVIE